MSREEFQGYWREAHAPLVAGRADVLGIRRYQQVHTVGGAADGEEGAVPEFDGVAEVWVDPTRRAAGRDALRRAGDDLLEDERRFIDLAASPICVADEVAVVGGSDTGDGGAPEGLRLTAALRRLPGTTREEFRRYWRDAHASLVRDRARALGYHRYVQLHTPDDAEASRLATERGAPAPFDGVAEVWLDDEPPDAGPAAEARARLLEDLARFADAAASPRWWGRVRVVVVDR